MKIVFLCGSLELGCDGVGDYVRRLAEELYVQGHQVGALALHDSEVAEELIENQLTAELAIPTLRIPNSWPAEKRFVKARGWIDAFNPEWLSFQFVIFSYHPKGLPFGLTRRLATLCKGRFLHIMFHELWVGMAKDSTKKNMLWGWIQKKLIISVLHTLKPTIIHTQMELYRVQIERLGFAARKLPLFSNISVSSHTTINNYETSHSDNETQISLVVFGLIHAGVPIEKFAGDVAHYAKTNDKTISLKIIGRSGAQQPYWVRVWETAGLPLEVLGEQSTEQISRVLSAATIGVSTTPVALAEKSGTVAAMREHGLAVLSISEPWESRYSISLNASPAVMQYRSGNLDAYFSAKKQAALASPVPEIAHQFINDLLSVR